MTKCLTPVENIIAQGKLAIIIALEGRKIYLGSGTYATVQNGRFLNPLPLASRQVLLTLCSTETLERYLRTSAENNKIER